MIVFGERSFLLHYINGSPGTRNNLVRYLGIHVDQMDFWMHSGFVLQSKNKLSPPNFHDCFRKTFSREATRAKCRGDLNCCLIRYNLQKQNSLKHRGSKLFNVRLKDRVLSYAPLKLIYIQVFDRGFKDNYLFLDSQLQNWLF